MRRTGAALALAGAACAVLIAPAAALDLNSFRAQHGLPKLTANKALTAKARAHAADMARRRSMDHDGFYERMAGHGAAAENVAAGCNNTDCVFRLWADSSGHAANMLNRSVTRYGLASARGRDGRRYWVLELSN